MPEPAHGWFTPGLNPWGMVAHGADLGNFPAEMSRSVHCWAQHANVRVLDRYELGSVIKRGGMGTVYEAHDTRLLNTCAVKEMDCDPDDAASLARFEREARLLARLSHPGLPRVIDYKVEGARAFLVMERVQGDDLETVLAAKKRLPPSRVVDIALQVLDVLEYLHGETPSILYKDLKPSNIMLRSDGSVVLVDFGVATAIRAVDPRNTAVGTPGYAPREQFLGQAETRSDLYSLGATMHHLLSGREPLVPFCFAPLRTLCSDVGRALEAVVHQALMNDPAARFPSAAMMKAALERASGVTVLPVPPPQACSPAGRPSGWAPASPSPTAWAPASSPASSPWSSWSASQPSPASPSWSWGASHTRRVGGALALPRGAEYTCAKCGQRVYSYSGLKLTCRACNGALREAPTAS